MIYKVYYQPNLSLEFKELIREKCIYSMSSEETALYDIEDTLDKIEEINQTEYKNSYINDINILKNMLKEDISYIEI